MTMYRILCTLLLLLTLRVGLAIDLTKVNMNYQINPYVSLIFQHQLSASEDEVELYYVLKFGPQKKLENYNTNFLTQPHYQSAEHRNINAAVTKEVLFIEGKKVHLRATIQKPFLDSLLIVEFTEIPDRDSFFFEIPVYAENNFPVAGFTFIDKDKLPMTDNFVKNEQTLTSDAVEKPLFGYYYSYEFSPAAPPMAREALPGKGTFRIDSTFKIAAADTFQLRQRGLYLFQSDTSTLAARALLAFDHNFPKYTSLRELMACTRYITSGTEFRSISNNPTKANFDELWLKMTGSTSRARTIIRRYYQRVEQANIFFTSYKEGWKTDQGMIYIIFGTPDEMYAGDDFQQWRYFGDDERAELSFTFVKVKDIFSRQHFELIRNSNYSNAWLNTIEKWRKGRL